MLKCNKVFDRIGGLILGKHEGFDDKGTNRKPYEVLEEMLGEYDFLIDKLTILEMVKLNE